MAFKDLPQALGHLPKANLWCVIYFLLLLTLAIDSSACTYKSVYTCACEFLKIPLIHRLWVRGVVAVIFCLSGMSLTTPGGVYVLKFMSTYSMFFNAFIAGLLWYLALYFYGTSLKLVFSEPHSGLEENI